MRAVEIIIKKRDGGELTKEEINFFVQGFDRGEIPDYQASAWAMAVLLKGMSPQETTDLTMAMVHSGEVLDLSSAVSFAVDKHSTGGVGDKTTLVVAPVVAACGLPVGKMSGRGLGFSGGTLDKLESIPGFRVDLSMAEFLSQLSKIGMVVTGQTADLAPADGKLYALRDVTGTVQSIPLIASSIMSKKIASGAQAIVLDVKVGCGAFMRTLPEAQALAMLMVEIGRLAGRETIALISDMNQPLGECVGNALELKEAVLTLHDQGPEDFREHCMVVAGEMLALGKHAANVQEGKRMAEQALKDGRAWEKFRAFVAAQGGDTRYIEDTGKLPAAPVISVVESPRAGTIQKVDAQVVGQTAVVLGAGRTRKGEAIDPAVGIQVHVKVGDAVRQGEPLFTLHVRDRASLEVARSQLVQAVGWSSDPVEALPLFYGIVRAAE
jgi:pyrimidine-nucleoside phosphorylase